MIIKVFEALTSKAKMRRFVVNVLIFIILSDVQIYPTLALASNETKDSSSSSSSATSNSIPNLFSRTSSSSPSSTQSSSSYDSSTETSSSYLPKERSDTQESTAQASSSSSSLINEHHHHHHHQHHQHPNHRDYHQDSYPSASYTSINPVASNQLNNFLNRDHHQSSSIVQANQDNSAPGSGLLTSNTYSSQSSVAPSHGGGHSTTSAADTMTSESYNHNYNVPGVAGGSSSTGSVQNHHHHSNSTFQTLPATSQLPNGTLLSLSELINKTRQANSLLYPMTDYTAATNYNTIGGHPGLTAGAQRQPQSASAPLSIHSDSYNYDNQAYASVFDHFRPLNQYRDSISHLYQQQQQQPQFVQPPPSLQQKFGHGSHLTGSSSGYATSAANSAPVTSSNSHQYYSGSVQQSPGTRTGPTSYYNALNSVLKSNLAAPSASPTTTAAAAANALNMALYEGYALDSGYRLPMLLNNLNSLLEQQNKPASSSHFGGALTATSSGPTLMSGNAHQTGSNSAQYLQYHNGANNQNHLDKIVYHSTPFRPSIANPPNGKSANPAGGLIKSIQGGSTRQKPEVESSKSMNFNTLVGSGFGDNKLTSESGGFENRTSDNSRFLKDSGFGRQPEANDPQTTTVLPPPSSDDFDFESRFNPNPNATQLASNSSFGQDSFGTNKSSTIGSSGVSPALLFDLYEREIDNQIREALYSTEHPLLSAARSPQNQWFEKTPSPVFEETDHSMSSWARPVALGSRLTGYFQRPRTHHHLTSDHLAAALQELPTFAASDLQPIYPTGPTYSILPAPSTAHHHDPTYSTDSHPSLASHSYPVVSTNAMSTLLDTETLGRPTSDYDQAASSSSSSSGSSSYGGLPAILLKLNSNSLSSILTGPLSHLYASLPRNRNNKKHNNNNNNNQHGHNSQHQSSTNQNNHFISPNSFFPIHPLGGITAGKSLFGALGGAGSSNSDGASSSSSSLKSYQHRRPKQHSQAGLMQAASSSQYQLHQAAVAAATANLMAAAAASAAAEGQQLTPLQAALIQAHATNSIGAYLNPLQHPLAGLNQEHEPLMANSNNVQNSASGATYESPGGGGGGGPLGLIGSLTPIIWRNFLSPAHWARKQSITSSGQTPIHQATSSLMPSFSIIPSFTSHYGSHKSNNNNSNSNSNNNHNNNTQNINKSLNKHHLSSMLSGGSLAAHLFSPITSASLNSIQFATKATTPSTATTSGSATSGGRQTTAAAAAAIAIPRRPKFEIKILKIPVAFYDQPPSTAGGDQQITNSAAIGIMPAPSSLTAAILANIPCTFSHTTSQPPHNLDQHIINPALAASLALSTILSPSSSTLQPAPSSSPFSSLPSPSSQSSGSSSMQQNLLSGPIISTPAASSSGQPKPLPITTSSSRDYATASTANSLSSDSPIQLDDLQVSSSNIQRKLLKMFQ